MTPDDIVNLMAVGAAMGVFLFMVIAGLIGGFAAGIWAVRKAMGDE
jgi:uncharacterized protein YneF (UPF0154 family)